MSRFIPLVIFPMLLLVVSACQPVKNGPVFDSVLYHWVAKPSPRPQGPALKPAEQRKQDMGALLHEMFQVVLLREPTGSGEFNSLWSPLVQGASIEGIYNGFVHSSRYSDLEQRTGRATAVAFQIFSNEIGPVEEGLTQPSELEVRDPAHYANASIFTLKRVLGDEALKVIRARIANPEDLAAWYGPWAARFARLQIDYGLPLRSNTDPAFHRKWLVDEMKQPNGADYVVWEILNRVHRLLNAAEEKGLRGGTPSGH
jgi:hypothetical protein